ncbi:MAG: chromosomal replication initiator protein DnaA [Erysipelotrichales bacterium]|nr:chromosomal replication initiator protein DnaA [Erysipelotrichales bacterium]
MSQNIDTRLQDFYTRTWKSIMELLQRDEIYDNLICDILNKSVYIGNITDDTIVLVCKNFVSKEIIKDRSNPAYIATYAARVLNSASAMTVIAIEESEYQRQFADEEDEEEPDYIRNWEDHISPEFTFENFVVGDSNRQAQLAALGCAYNPGAYFNPLFIYGDSGLGKTHLLHAIGNYIKKQDPSKRVLYLPTGDLTSQYVDATKQKGFSTQELMDKIKSVDVLLLDDVQFLAGKEKTGTFFFQIYNSLVSNHKQIVLTSDTSPFDMNNIDIEDRLVSRFSSGLTVTISSPEFETRLEILKMKVREQPSYTDGQSIDDETLAYIAANCTGDVRKLEGMLNQFMFYQIQYADADDQKVLKEIVKQDLSNQELDCGKIIRAVGDYYRLTKAQLVSKSRSANIVIARHMAMYLCRKELDEPFNKIGNYFNRSDHTTVMSACKKMESLIKNDSNYRKAVQEIEERLR